MTESIDRDSLLLKEQTRQLYAGLNSSLIATLVLACMLVGVLWQHVSREVIIAWWLAMFAIVSFRAVTAYRFHKASPDETEILAWRAPPGAPAACCSSYRNTRPFRRFSPS